MAESFESILNRYTNNKIINTRQSAQGFGRLAEQGSIGAALTFGLLSRQADRADSQEAVFNAQLQNQQLQLDRRRVASGEVSANANARLSNSRADNVDKTTSQMDQLLAMRDRLEKAQIAGVDVTTRLNENKLALEKMFGAGDRQLAQDSTKAVIRNTDARTEGTNAQTISVGIGNDIASGTAASTIDSTNATNRAVASTAQEKAEEELYGLKVGNDGRVISNESGVIANDFANRSFDTRLATGERQLNNLGLTGTGIGIQNDARQNALDNDIIFEPQERKAGIGFTNAQSGQVGANTDRIGLGNTFTRQTQPQLVTATNATSGATVATQNQVKQNAPATAAAVLQEQQGRGAVNQAQGTVATNTTAQATRARNATLSSEAETVQEKARTELARSKAETRRVEALADITDATAPSTIDATIAKQDAITSTAGDQARANVNQTQTTTALNKFTTQFNARVKTEEFGLLVEQAKRANLNTKIETVRGVMNSMIQQSQEGRAGENHAIKTIGAKITAMNTVGQMREQLAVIDNGIAEAQSTGLFKWFSDDHTVEELNTAKSLILRQMKLYQQVGVEQ